MLYTIEKLPDDPIILTVLGDEFDLASDTERSVIDTIKILDACTEKVYAIVDMTAVSFTATDILHSSNVVGPQYQMFKHPNIIENITITQNQLLRLAGKGFDSAAFGNVKMLVFDTREEAFTYIRGKLSDQRR